MTRRRRPQKIHRVIVATAVVLVAAALVRIAIHKVSGDTRFAPCPVASPSPDSATAQSAPGPSRIDKGIPSGFAHTEAGATAAATAYVLTGQRLLELTPTEVSGAIATMTASASTSGQVADAQRQLSELRAVLSDGRGPIRYAQAVLAVRMDAYAPERARVSVWSVGVLSRQGVAAPQAGWTTSTFELVWERGDWKTWSETITPGPAPALNAGAAPATSEELEQQLSGFESWRWGW
jgi:hypothetical protein